MSCELSSLSDGHRRAAASAQRRAAVDLHFLHRGHGLEFDMEARWIRSQLPRRCGRVADIGCGNGALFPWIGPERVIGFDFAAAGLRVTRSRFAGVPVIAGCAEHLPTASGSFDAIVMQHVIEHLKDVEEAARGWYRALRNGGRLIVVTPNAQFKDPSVYDDPTHTHIFAPRELCEVLMGAGFDVCDVRTLGLPILRNYGRVPGGWRLRRGVIYGAGFLSRIPGLRAGGQSLCCAVRRSR